MKGTLELSDWAGTLRGFLCFFGAVLALDAFGPGGSVLVTQCKGFLKWGSQKDELLQELH